MSYVPVISTSAPPSPRARELGSQMAGLIDEFRRQNPGTTGDDIRQALRLAAPDAGTTSRAHLAITVGALLLLLLGGLFFALRLTGGR